MKLRFNVLLTMATVVAAMPALAQTYTLQDLGILPGDTESTGTGLNDLGQACGTSGGLATATLFSNGQTIDLGGLVSGDVTVANGINNSTVVVGDELFASTVPETPHALVWSNGGIQDINSASLFPGGTEATAINDSGEIAGVGYLDNTGDTFLVFTYANGKMVNIGPSDAFQAVPVALNNNGQILVSYATTKASGYAIYSNGAFTPVAAGPKGTTVTPFAMNDNGEIVGSIVTPNGTNTVGHAALYSNGVWTDLGTLVGATVGTEAVGINNAGQIIGTAFNKQVSYHPPVPGATIACVLQNGVWVNLNTLVPTNSFHLSRAISINEAGQILCDTKTQKGISVSNQHAVLLSPK